MPITLNQNKITFKDNNGNTNESSAFLLGSTYNLEQRLNKLETEGVAPAHVAAHSYAVGDYVTYGDNLYKCKTAHTSESATLDASKWTKVSMVEDYNSELTDLKSALQQNKILFNFALFDGYYSADGSIVESHPRGEKRTSLLEIDEHTDLKITVESDGGNSPQWISYCEFSESQNFIRRIVLVSEERIPTYSKRLTFSTDVKYVVVQFRACDYSSQVIPYTLSVVGIKNSQATDNNRLSILKTRWGEYINSSNETSMNANPYQNCTTGIVPVLPEEEIKLSIKITIPKFTSSERLWIAYCFYNDDTRLTSRTVKSEYVYGYIERNYSIKVPSNANFLHISCNLYEDGILTISSSSNVTFLSAYDLGKMRIDQKQLLMFNPNIKSINHRGLNTGAPENTIPAFKLSAKVGFKYVETDVRFTSDGIPVLLHDATINRTARNADGSEIEEDIYIANITYEQALTYDFGIYKEVETYAGTKIPTLEEFLNFCKFTGLHPYLELKAGDENQIQQIVDLVYRYGMSKNITYIGFSLLTYVKNYDPYARLGYICNGITTSVISTVESLQTGYNEVFIDDAYGTGDAIDTAISKRIPIEVWQTSDYTTKPFISGYTTDMNIIGDRLKTRVLLNNDDIYIPV